MDKKKSRSRDVSWMTFVVLALVVVFVAIVIEFPSHHAVSIAEAVEKEFSSP